MMPSILLVSFLLFASAAPPLTTIDENGFRKLVESNKGKVVLYDFWATWCAGCRAEMPDLVKLDKKLRPSGFVLVTISADEPEMAAGAAKIAGQSGVTGPAYLKQAHNDENFMNSVDRAWSGALPALFLYDKSGRRVRSFFGTTDTATLEKAIRALL